VPGHIFATYFKVIFGQNRRWATVSVRKLTIAAAPFAVCSSSTVQQHCMVVPASKWPKRAFMPRQPAEAGGGRRMLWTQPAASGRIRQCSMVYRTVETSHRHWTKKRAANLRLAALILLASIVNQGVVICRGKSNQRQHPNRYR